jgi:hypothetical protein
MRTKSTIIREIRAKASKASPMVKRVFFRGLEYKTKPQLERILKRMRVTREGDIRLS